MNLGGFLGSALMGGAKGAVDANIRVKEEERAAELERRRQENYMNMQQAFQAEQMKQQDALSRDRMLFQNELNQGNAARGYLDGFQVSRSDFDKMTPEEQARVVSPDQRELSMTEQKARLASRFQRSADNAPADLRKMQMLGLPMNAEGYAALKAIESGGRGGGLTSKDILDRKMELRVEYNQLVDSLAGQEKGGFLGIGGEQVPIPSFAEFIVKKYPDMAPYLTNNDLQNPSGPMALGQPANEDETIVEQIFARLMQEPRSQQKELIAELEENGKPVLAKKLKRKLEDKQKEDVKKVKGELFQKEKDAVRQDWEDWRNENPYAIPPNPAMLSQ